MRGRVAQREQRMERRNRLPRNLALHILRLVHDHDRPALLDELDRLPALHPVALPPHHVLIPRERLNVHHEHLELIAHRELPQPRHLRRIINPRVHRHVTVQRREMLRRHPQALHHALPDRHARHHNHEFPPPILAVQVVDRAEINVGLPRARLHFHGEVTRAKNLVCRQLFRRLLFRFEPALATHSAQIVQKPRIRKYRASSPRRGGRAIARRRHPAAIQTCHPPAAVRETTPPRPRLRRADIAAARRIETSSCANGKRSGADGAARSSAGARGSVPARLAHA